MMMMTTILYNNIINNFFDYYIIYIVLYYLEKFFNIFFSSPSSSSSSSFGFTCLIAACSQASACKHNEPSLIRTAEETKTLFTPRDQKQMTDSRIALFQKFASNARRGLFRKQKRSLSTTSQPSGRYAFETLFAKNHQNLPRLPIPTLEDTCSRYLRSVEHLCTSPRQFEIIKDEVNDFRTRYGPTFHQKVIQNDQHFESLGKVVLHFILRKPGTMATWQHDAQIHQYKPILYFEGPQRDQNFKIQVFDWLVSYTQR